MPRTITGQNLARKKRTPTERGLLAADLAAGRVVVSDLTLRQAVMLTGASPSYASAAAALDDRERSAVARGWRRLIPYIAKQALPVPAPTIAITDRDLESVIRVVGIDRMLEAAVAVEHHI
jgi:hypothetical protein